MKNPRVKDLKCVHQNDPFYESILVLNAKKKVPCKTVQ